MLFRSQNSGMNHSNQHGDLGIWVNFLLGGISAGVSKTAAAPIERVKLLVQSQGEILKTGKLDRPYNGIIDCFRRVIREEGFLALWRGNLANVVRYFPTQALNFAAKDWLKDKFGYTKEKHGYGKWFMGNIVSGGLAGAFSLVFVYSLDYARTRLGNDINQQAKGGVRQFTGLWDVYVKTWRSDGMAGLYRGFWVSCTGIIVCRGVYFGFYDSFKPFVLVGSLKDSFIAAFLLGWAVTIAADIISYPIDTIRRRMMMTSGEAIKYRNSFHCAGSIYKHEGVKAFFKGAGANILRAVAGAGVLAGFDKLEDWYIRYALAPKAQKKE